MKKRLLSTFLCFFMALTLLPAPARAAVSGVTVDTAQQCINAKGNPITLKAGSAADKTLIYLDSDLTTPIELTGVEGNATDGYDLSEYTVYGNCYYTYFPAATVASASVTMEGGKVSRISGGEGTSTSGANPTAVITGESAVILKGGTVGSIYTGGSCGATTGSTRTVIEGGTVERSVVTGHNSSGKVLDSMTLTMTGGTVGGIIAKTSDAQDKTAGGVTVSISGGTVLQAVCSRAGSWVDEEAALTVSGSAQIGGTNDAGLQYNTFRSVTLQGAPTVCFQLPGGASAGDALAAASSLTGLSLCGSNADKLTLSLSGGNVVLAPPPHIHAVSVGCEKDGGEQVTFKPLTSSLDGKLYIDGRAATEADRFYELPAGHYYLAGDVRLNKFIYTSASTDNSVLDLCLNGYKLEYAGGENSKNVIFVGRGDQTFNLCDCNPTGKDHTANVINDPISGYTKDIWGGVITGATRATIEQPGNAPVTIYGGTIAGNSSSSVSGGGVYAKNFVMHGGAIRYNKASKGGGVFAINSFTMTGGTIHQNQATGDAGGVRLGESATATLSGNAVISDNVAGTAKTPNNLRLETGVTVTVAPEGLGENAHIGVTTKAPTDTSPVTVAVAEAGHTLTADDLAKFSSDNSDYELKLSEGSIVLAKPEPYAITQQPTADNGYTVAASHPDKARYQWYRSDDNAGIGTKIAQEGAAFGSAAEDATYESDGHWTGTVKNGVCEFFTLNLKAGQLVYLDFEDGCKNKTFTLTGDNGETVTATPAVSYLYLPVPADGSYTLRISGLTGSSATLWSAKLYPPLAGQTGATLVPAKGGRHFCLVTWEGTDQYEQSNSVTPVIATTGLTVEPETLTLQVGKSKILTVTRTPEDANDGLTWASSDESVATVRGGRVSAVGAGTATVSATANGITASCVVTVTPVPAITQQPTAENKYTVGVNYAPQGIAYRWYPATVTAADITLENAQIFDEPDCTQPSAFEDGKWSASQSEDYYVGYFTAALKEGDAVTVTMATAEKPTVGQLGLARVDLDPDEYAPEVWYPFGGTGHFSHVGTATTDGDNTVITYIIPADGSYDLILDGLYADDVIPPALSAKVTHVELGEAVTGQTTAQLTVTAEGDYLCEVTWPDGTVLRSDPVTYTPAPGKTEGEVEVNGEGTPAVSVAEEALKSLAGEVQAGSTVTVKLTVEKLTAPAEKDEIEQLVTGKKDDVLYLDLSLVKRVNNAAPEAITDTEGTVLEIAVDYDFAGKKDVTVYRKHASSAAAALTKLSARPAAPFAEGSFFADRANGKVYIYAGKFSTYAIGYAKETATQPSSSSSSSYRWPFTDVKRTDAFYQAVKYVYDKKLMEGTSATTFDPEGALTRAMLATVLYRAAGSPKTEGAPEFDDTEAGTWYADAVVWAAQTGVLRGYGNGKFGPDDTVSREMLNMVVARRSGADPAWTGDAALAAPAQRHEIAAMLAPAK